jgi:hypothetical protein
MQQDAETASRYGRVRKPRPVVNPGIEPILARV